MAHVDTPWVGLGALAVMFAIPFLPSWLFEGPKVVRHRPRRQVCAICGAAWRDDHDCVTAAETVSRPLPGWLGRTSERPAITSRTAPPSERDDF